MFKLLTCLVFSVGVAFGQASGSGRVLGDATSAQITASPLEWYRTATPDERGNCRAELRDERPYYDTSIPIAGAYYKLRMHGKSLVVLTYACGSEFSVDILDSIRRSIEKGREDATGIGAFTQPHLTGQAVTIDAGLIDAPKGELEICTRRIIGLPESLSFSEVYFRVNGKIYGRDSGACVTIHALSVTTDEDSDGNQK